MDRRQLPKSAGSTDLGIGWTRPSDWISMPDPTGTQTWYGILAIYEDSPNYIALKFTGAVTIDWGDGNTENVASNTQANHSYTWASISSGTLSSRGYRQALVTVTPQGGQNITVVNMVARHTSAPAVTNYGAPWLDVSMAGTNIATLTLGNASISAVVSFHMLERVQVLGQTAITSFANVFGSLPALQKVNNDIDFSGVTGVDGMFIYSTGLIVGPTFDLSAASAPTASQMFESCSALTSVSISAPTASNVGSMFYQCVALQDVVVRAPVATTLTNMFKNCYSLVDASNVSVWGGVTLGSMFSACYSLKKLPTKNGWTRFSAATSTDSMFLQCYSLEKVNFAVGGNNCSWISTFANCFSLRRAAIEIPATGSCSLNTTFGSCRSLLSVVVTSAGTGITSMTSTFQSCTRLLAVSLPTTASCTSFYATFASCNNLQDLPTLDTTSATDMSYMFSDAKRLNSLPSWLDLNGVTGSGATIVFQYCRNVTTIPAYDMSTISTASSLFSDMPQVSRILYTGMGVTHSIANCSLSATALNEVYTNLKNGVTSKTITVTGNPGVSGDDPTIATAKGWTVTG